MVDCTDSKRVESLQSEFKGSTVQIHSAAGKQEYAAFTQGMELVDTELACLLRDDDMPGEDPLWVSHFLRLFANNPRLGMGTCAGTVLERFRPFERSPWIGWGEGRDYMDVATGDGCCAYSHCGNASTKLFLKNNAPAEEVQQNWNTTHFTYISPRHSSVMVVNKKAWAEINGGFKPYHEPELRPDWEVEFQHKLWAAGYAVGATDCNPYPGRLYCRVVQSSEHRHSTACTNEERPKTAWFPSQRYFDSRAPFQPPTPSNANNPVPLASVVLWKKGPYICG
jgi:hypothetical protein